MKKILFIFCTLIVVGFAYWAISPLFRTVTVQESAPIDTSGSLVTPTQVSGTSGHPASGTVKILTSNGKKYLRYENFHTINGPDLFVYLATDTEAHDFVSLGVLKATDGNINYEIPEGTDVKKYTHALVWCKTFGVLFNSADLTNTL